MLGGRCSALGASRRLHSLQQFQTFPEVPAARGHVSIRRRTFALGYRGAPEPAGELPADALATTTTGFSTAAAAGNAVTKCTAAKRIFAGNGSDNHTNRTHTLRKCSAGSSEPGSNGSSCCSRTTTYNGRATTSNRHYEHLPLATTTNHPFQLYGNTQPPTATTTTTSSWNSTTPCHHQHASITTPTATTAATAAHIGDSCTEPYSLCNSSRTTSSGSSSSSRAASSSNNTADSSTMHLSSSTSCCSSPVSSPRPSPSPPFPPARSASHPAACPPLPPLVEDTSLATWHYPLRKPGSVVALGKFDALHRGHRALAAAAAQLAAEIAAVQQVPEQQLSEQQQQTAPLASSSTINRRTPCGGGSGGSSSNGNNSSNSTSNDNRDSTTCSSNSPSSISSGNISSGSNSSSNNTPAAPGDAVLLSFSGMAGVLGWAARLPLTAPQDRGRVLAGWGAGGGRGGTGEGEGAAAPASAPSSSAAAPTAPSTAPSPAAPLLRTLPFSCIRDMGPEAFVRCLAGQLRAAGVVAGRNYRFGYKAAGDAAALVRLGQQYGMRVRIVDLVELADEEDDERDQLGAGSSNNGGDGNNNSSSSSSSDSSSSVSSSRIRELLAAGRVAAVERLLGRKYRLVCELGGATATAAAVGISAATAGGDSGDGPAALSVDTASTAVAATAAAAAGVLVETVQRESCASSSSSSGSSPSTARGFFVPYSCYQNQPPANGRYRARVRLVVAGPPGAEIPPDDMDEDEEFEKGRQEQQGRLGDGESVDEGRGSRVESETQGGAGANVGLGMRSACAVVTLSDAGLEVGVSSDDGSDAVLGLVVGGSSVASGLLLLVDFDACC